MCVRVWCVCVCVCGGACLCGLCGHKLYNDMGMTWVLQGEGDL